MRINRRYHVVMVTFYRKLLATLFILFNISVFATHSVEDSSTTNQQIAEIYVYGDAVVSNQNLLTNSKIVKIPNEKKFKNSPRVVEVRSREKITKEIVKTSEKKKLPQDVFIRTNFSIPVNSNFTKGSYSRVTSLLPDVHVIVLWKRTFYYTVKNRIEEPKVLFRTLVDSNFSQKFLHEFSVRPPPFLI